ncbi:MAG: hypothetical protein JRN21_04315 [Nitrososphaerota archaeon]|nr:hypothetical protein [Nitrososphaerota archaeon]
MRWNDAVGLAMPVFPLAVWTLIVVFVNPSTIPSQLSVSVVVLMMVWGVFSLPAAVLFPSNNSTKAFGFVVWVYAALIAVIITFAISPLQM